MVSCGVQLAAAGAGAGIGGCASGKEGAITGMQLGASVRAINPNAGAALNLAQTSAKVGGMAIGGSVAAAATKDDPEQRGSAFQYGLQVGLSVGGSIGGMASSGGPRLEGLLDVGAEGAAIAGGAVLDAAREDDRSFVDAAQTARGFARAAVGAATSDNPSEAARVIAEVGEAAGRAAMEEIKGRELQLAQRAAQRGSKSAAKKAERLSKDYQKWMGVAEIGSQLADAATELRTILQDQAERSKPKLA
jgi:hypothetical protein